MLMHASTHSSNFDENVSSTTFTLTIIAYQWGWNYFFPRDVVESLTGGARIVGHGGIDESRGQLSNEFVAERARADFLLRAGSRGADFSREGLSAAPGTLALLARPDSRLGFMQQASLSDLSSIESELDARDSVSEPAAESTLSVAGSLVDDAGAVAAFGRLRVPAVSLSQTELSWGDSLVSIADMEESVVGSDVSADALSLVSELTGLPAEPSSLRVWLDDSARSRRSLVASGSRLTSVFEHASATAGLCGRARSEPVKPVLPGWGGNSLLPVRAARGSLGQPASANVFMSSSDQREKAVSGGAGSDYCGSIIIETVSEVGAEDHEIAYLPAASASLSAAAVRARANTVSSITTSASDLIAESSMADSPMVRGSWARL